MILLHKLQTIKYKEAYVEETIYDLFSLLVDFKNNLNLKNNSSFEQELNKSLSTITKPELLKEFQSFSSPHLFLINSQKPEIQRVFQDIHFQYWLSANSTIFLESNLFSTLKSSFERYLNPISPDPDALITKIDTHNEHFHNPDRQKYNLNFFKKLIETKSFFDFEIVLNKIEDKIDNLLNQADFSIHEERFLNPFCIYFSAYEFFLKHTYKFTTNTSENAIYQLQTKSRFIKKYFNNLLDIFSNKHKDLYLKTLTELEIFTLHNKLDENCINYLDNITNVIIEHIDHNEALNFQLYVYEYFLKLKEPAFSLIENFLRISPSDYFNIETDINNPNNIILSFHPKINTLFPNPHILNVIGYLFTNHSESKTLSLISNQSHLNNTKNIINSTNNPSEPFKFLSFFSLELKEEYSFITAKDIQKIILEICLTKIDHSILLKEHIDNIFSSYVRELILNKSLENNSTNFQNKKHKI